MKNRQQSEPRLRRLYAPGLRELLLGGQAGGQTALGEGEAHHALHVLRLGEGDEVEVFDGAGGRARATICTAGKRDVVVQVRQALEARPAPAPAIHLAFAAPKGNRLDWLLEKATELAAASLTPVIFERSATSRDELGPQKLAKWTAHCIAAAKQCGLDYLPEIRQAVPLAALLERAEGLRLVGDAGEGSMPLKAALAGRAIDQVTLMVGPEGGLSPAERAAAITAGFQPVRIGATVLRVETAGIALVAGVRAILGD